MSTATPSPSRLKRQLGLWSATALVVGQIFSAVVIVSVLGSRAAVIMAAPRVYYAMARDHLFVPGAAALHPRFAAPARAIAMQAAMASVLVALGKPKELLYGVAVVALGLPVYQLLFRKGKQTHDVD